MGTTEDVETVRFVVEGEEVDVASMIVDEGELDVGRLRSTDCVELS